MRITDRLTYFYLRKIKKWMICPNCNKPTLKINKAGSIWFCSECGYKIDREEFENGCIFWFCDNCNTFLNIQDGFNTDEGIWICEKCGCLNDTSSENIIGVCKYCGKELDNPDQTICDECRTQRLIELKNKTEIAQKVLMQVKEERLEDE